jgi:hypothetical protein
MTGSDRQGEHGLGTSRSGDDWNGEARHADVRTGEACRGSAGNGADWQGFLQHRNGLDRSGWPRTGEAGSGAASRFSLKQECRLGSSSSGPIETRRRGCRRRAAGVLRQERNDVRIHDGRRIDSAIAQAV